MVYSWASQPDSSYELWKQFSMPLDEDSQQAVAIPSKYAPYLISLYTILMVSMVASAWCILFAIILYFRLTRNKLHPMSTSLWNRKHCLSESLFDLVHWDGNRKKWSQPWFIPVVFIFLALWAAQAALSIFTPSFILLGNAAPVNPTAIIVPNNSVPHDDNYLRKQVELFDLDVQAALRAVAVAQVASHDIQSKVSVSATQLGKTSDGEVVNQYQYNYSVSGRDLGLQNFPTLLLTVNGSCITEYGWFLESYTENYTDTYSSFGDPDPDGIVTIGSMDSNIVPVALFYPGPKHNKTKWQSNMTWAAYVSSAYRLSSSKGTDPFYETEESPQDGFYPIKSARPVLSCWETDSWSFKGHNSNNTLWLNDTLPGLGLPYPLGLIIGRNLGVPRIVDIGSLLGFSALLSGIKALGVLVDASRANMAEDLKRLVLTSYIATTNMLTETTLYAELPPDMKNMVMTDDGQPMDGLGGFIVWTSDATALSLKYIILIPLLTVVLWLSVFYLLQFTRVRVVGSLDASVLHKTILEKAPTARPCAGGTWKSEEEAKEALMLADWGYDELQQPAAVPATEANEGGYDQYAKTFRDSGVSTGTAESTTAFSSAWRPRGIDETMAETYDVTDAQPGMASPWSGAGSPGEPLYFSASGRGNESGNGHGQAEDSIFWNNSVRTQGFNTRPTPAYNFYSHGD